LRVHAIIIALNEDYFIRETIRPLYPHCSGISVLTQFDRNYRGERVLPDKTVENVLSFDDPDGKISLVMRRYIDEAACRNHEMLAVLNSPYKRIKPHDATRSELGQKYSRPDYFLIVDADEIFDIDTVGNLFEFVQRRKPRVCRIEGYEYAGSWNRRVSPERWVNRRIGLIRPGIFFKTRRAISLWEHRLKRVCKRMSMNESFVDRLLGLDICPREIAAFHHGGLVRSAVRLAARANNHSEKSLYEFVNYLAEDATQEANDVATLDLPRNIIEAGWPEGLIRR